jgi:hypothetical protein
MTIIGVLKMKKKHIFILVLGFLLALSSLLTGKNKKIELSVLGSVNVFKMSFNDGEGFPLPRHKAKLAYSFGPGILFALSKNLSLELDLLYKTKKSELVEFSGIQWGDAFYRLNYISLPAMVHYQISISTFSIFAALGLETEILLKSRINDKKNHILIKKIENIKDYNFQLISGLGLRYKCISLEFRYGLGILNLNTEGNDLTVKSKGFELLAAIHF